MTIQEPISDSRHGGGLTGSSDEAAVMVVERSGRVIQLEVLDNY